MQQLLLGKVIAGHLRLIFLTLAAAAVCISCAHLAGPPGTPDMPPPDLAQGEPLWLKLQRHPECGNFLDDTREQRRTLHIKRFDYFEAARKPETSGFALQIEHDMKRLEFEIFQRAPVTCRDPFLIGR